MLREIAKVEKVAVIARIAAGEIDDNSPEGLDARCYSGVEYLVYHAGMSRADGYRAIQTLTDLGYLDKPVKRKRKKNVTHYRRVNKQRLEAMLAMLPASKKAYEDYMASCGIIEEEAPDILEDMDEDEDYQEFKRNLVSQ
jgi:hypothetical protein